MKFGVREIVEVVLRAKSRMRVGKRTFYRNDPVIYFDKLTTSSLEGAATTVYAQGGRGNPRLMAWEGERTLTFNMTDALLSPESFMILSGAGLVDAAATESADGYEKPLYVHTTSQVAAAKDNYIVIPNVACWSHSGEMTKTYYHDGADIFVMVLSNGEIVGEPCIPAAGGVYHGRPATEADVAAAKTADPDTDLKVGDFVGDTANPVWTMIECTNDGNGIPAGTIVLVDYYVKRTSGVRQIEITPDKFGGYFYLEGSTLFRRESDGVDMPAEIVIPKVKIQSNFTFTMASTGDPSTFDFVMDAFPDYTKFDGTKEVLAIMQIVEEDEGEESGADMERRGHCKQAEEVTISADAGAFDHWKTYGELNQFGKADATKVDGGYIDGGYLYTDKDGNTSLKPDAKDAAENAEIKKNYLS